MKKYFILLGLFFCLACEENVQENNTSIPQDTLELSQPIQIESNRMVNLTPEAKEAVSEWLSYATAQNEIENMRDATGEEIVENSEPLLQIMVNLSLTVPIPLQTTAVQARTNVLHTKAGVLHQLANKKNKNPGEIYRAANELIEEFNNFKLQLNEVFLKTPEDFDLELDKEFEESRGQDTLMRVREEL